jgi:hypothetical protein
MLNKVCFEQKVARRAQSFPLKGNRRAETLRRLSKSEIRRDNTRSVWEKLILSPKAQRCKFLFQVQKLRRLQNMQVGIISLLEDVEG